MLPEELGTHSMKNSALISAVLASLVALTTAPSHAIVNGEVDITNAFEFVVQLTLEDDSGESYGCSGPAISKRVILMSAHCGYNHDENDRTSPRAYRTPTRVEVRTAKGYFVHTKFLKMDVSKKYVAVFSDRTHDDGWKTVEYLQHDVAVLVMAEDLEIEHFPTTIVDAIGKQVIDALMDSNGGIDKQQLAVERFLQNKVALVGRDPKTYIAGFGISSCGGTYHYKGTDREAWLDCTDSRDNLRRFLRGHLSPISMCGAENPYGLGRGDFGVEFWCTIASKTPYAGTLRGDSGGPVMFEGLDGNLIVAGLISGWDPRAEIDKGVQEISASLLGNLDLLAPYLNLQTAAPSATPAASGNASGDAANPLPLTNKAGPDGRCVFVAHLGQWGLDVDPEIARLWILKPLNMTVNSADKSIPFAMDIYATIDQKGHLPNGTRGLYQKFIMRFHKADNLNSLVDQDTKNILLAGIREFTVTVDGQQQSRETSFRTADLPDLAAYARSGKDIEIRVRFDAETAVWKFHDNEFAQALQASEALRKESATSPNRAGPSQCINPVKVDTSERIWENN